MKSSTVNTIKLDVLLGRVGSDLEMHDGLWKSMQQKLSYDEFMRGVAYPTLMTICRDTELKSGGRNFAMLLLTSVGEFYGREKLVENAFRYIDFARKLLCVSRGTYALNLGNVRYEQVRWICDYMFSDFSIDIGEVQLNAMMEGLKEIQGDAKGIANQRVFMDKVLQRMAHTMRESARANNKNLAIVEEGIQSMMKTMEDRINSMLNKS